MNFKTIYSLLDKNRGPVFSTQQILLLDENFNRENLYHRQKSGKIIQIKKGRYVFSDRMVSESDGFVVASQIVQPSYISMESALNIYNLIPEAVLKITSITPKKTQTIQSQFGSYLYRSMSSKLFWGYTIQKGGWYLATVEKAVLDYFYYHNELIAEEDFYEWRVSISEFHKQVDRVTFESYLQKFENNAMSKRVNSFLKYIDNA